MSVKRRTTNASSLLLNPDENETLFNILGRGCVTLASGVCQLYTADAPTTHKWSKRFCGVVCFVKDNPKRSYYIRLYDIKKDALIWEQEIYNQFKYKAPREYFHTFEADNVQAGLNFASEDEAIKFKNAVEQKLLERHQKKLERKRQQGSSHGSHSHATSPVQNSAVPAQAPVVTVDIKSGTNTVKSKGKKDKKKKLTKEDISTPTAFRHVSHVGWDPTKGFDMNNLDNDMKSLFEQVGITNTTDVDKETVDFIYDFVEQHGGMDKLKEEMKKKPPPIPGYSSGAPAPPPSRNAGPPPAPPSRAGPPPPQRSGQPPPPPSRSTAPPPTPARSMGSPPAPPSFNAPAPPPQSAKGPPPMAPAPGVPPPPPPPPAAPAAPPPPPAPAMPPAGAPAGGAGRGALLDSIRAGTTLKHNTEPNRGSGGSGGGGDARANLMDAIRSGKQLKAVEKEDRPDSEPSQEGGIVGALAMALANRQKQLQMSDDEDEDEDDIDDEDEWDD